MSYSTKGMLSQLIMEIRNDRRKDLLRAIEFHDSDPVMAAYHTGLADGRNGIAESLETLLNSTSITKGDRVNGRQ